MSKLVIERLTDQLQAQGSGFALVDDSVTAVMRISTDKTINGMSEMSLVFQYGRSQKYR